MPEHRHGPGCIGIEDPAVYDGVSWWMCDDGMRRDARRVFAPPQKWAQGAVCAPLSDQEAGLIPEAEPSALNRARSEIGHSFDQAKEGQL